MKIRIVLLCLLVITTLFGCRKAPAELPSDPAGPSAQAPFAADTAAYRLPISSQWFIGIDSYEEMSAHLDAQESPLPNLAPAFGTAQIEDDCVLLQVNEEQKQAVMDAAVRLLPQCCQVYNAVSPGNYVEWSSDFSALTYGFDYSVLLNPDHTIGMLWDLSTSTIINAIVQCNRILLTGDCDAPIAVNYKNPETGYLLASSLFPYEPLSMSDADWRRSAAEDVLVPAGKENEKYIKMELRELLSDRIVFAPLETDSYFSDEALVAISRLNDGKDALCIPSRFEPGDVFYLRVDGTYEDMEDDSPIPLIRFSGMIPERYFSLKE